MLFFTSYSRYEFKGRVYDRPASFDERVRQYGYPKPDAEYWDKAGGTQYKVKKKGYILGSQINATSPLSWFFLMVFGYFFMFSYDTTSELNQDITAFMTPSEIAKARRERFGQIDNLLNKKKGGHGRKTDGLPQQSMITPSQDLANELKKKQILEKYGDDQQKKQILKKYGPSEQPSFRPLQQPPHRSE